MPEKLYPLLSSVFGWDMVYQFIEQDMQLSPTLKQDWKQAVGFLKAELGKGFFNNCGRNHPVLSMLRGVGEGQVVDLVKLVELLRQLKITDTNYPVLISKITSKRATNEGFPFLEIARRHILQGFSVYFLEEVQGQKNPDIRLRHEPTGELVFVELSKLNESEKRSLAWEQYRRLRNVMTFYGYDYPCAGQLHQYIADRAVENMVIETIKKLKDEVYENKHIASYSDEYLSIAFADAGSIQALDQWCAQHKVQRRFQGLPVEFKDTYRLVGRGRIKDEAIQIHPDQCGLLYFPIQFLYFMDLSNDLPAAIDSFTSALLPFTHIIGLVLYTEIIGANQTPFLLEDGHLLSLTANESGIQRYTLFVQNSNFKGSLSSAAMADLKKAMV
ncbi:MAG TPA: hypothetical protein VF974_07805 [Patescibacteria group bacterium]